MSTKIIAVEKSQRIADIERFYETLYSYFNPDLLLPTRLKGDHIGTVGALIQFIATWSRISGQGSLLTYINENSLVDIELDRLCQEFHGLVATQFADENRITDRTKNKKLGLLLKGKSLDVLKKYAAYSSEFKVNYRQRNKTVLLGCFDDTLLEYPSYFYDNSSKIKSSSDFVTLLDSILKVLSTIETSKFKNSYYDPARTIVENLGIACKELIHNTEAWGKTKYNSKVTYHPNFRGLIVQIHEHGAIKNPIDPADLFVNNVLENNVKKNKERDLLDRQAFVELSIIDSGPGYARTMSKKDYNELTIAEEYQCVLKCFQLNVSSGNDPGRGYGLTTTLTKIGKSAFLRLRTGRLCLYRDFYSENLDEQDEIKNRNIKFKDWKTQKYNSPTKLPIAEGTLITIIYPFTY